MTGSLGTIDALLHLAAAVMYAVAFTLLVAEVVLHRSTGRAALASAGAGLALHVGGIAAHWVAVGHGPIVTKYENLSSYALATAVLALYFVVRGSSIRRLGLVLFPAAFLLVGLGLYSGPEVANLPPTFSGIWLVLHVCFYFIAFATALTAVGAAVLAGFPERLSAEVVERFPAAEELDRTAYRYAGLAFTFWGIGMLTGAVWAFHAWGRYWAWDPVESWSLLTWLLLGLYLHMRRFYGWQGRKAAWLLVLSFAFAIVALFGTTLMSGSLHAVYFR